ncbi:MAG: hypothetical protein LOD87_06800, partial [Planifilum fulgidum]
MNRRRWGILGLAVLLIVTAAWFIPAPYFVLRPGTAVPVLQLVDVAGGNFREKGRFLLTTVSVSEASALQCLFAWMIPGSSLVPREKLLEPGESPDAYRLR